MPSPLTVYRASAGAGKTFRLVVEYIKLLMLRPDEYKHILAVTFTKKATQEMKIRILSQLYGLREGLSSSDGYLDCISDEMNLPKHEIKKNAGIALNMILNDYGHFRIETIDSFFQSVLRNMTRELGINSNMRVEINGTQVEEKAVDALIDSLEPNDHLFKRVVSFAQEKMSEGKKWNVIESLKSFGKSIFTNFYQSHAVQYKECTAEEEHFKNYKDFLNQSIKAAEDEILVAARRLLSLIDERGIDVSIFSRNNNGFARLRDNILKRNVTSVQKVLQDYSQSEDEWFTKANAKKYSTLLPVIREDFMPALNDYLLLQQRNVKLILTCKVILSNLNNIEILGYIEKAVDESNEASNRFLLSSTNHLLSEMIDDSDSPFIYEKIGTQIKHLMIDEFQDTSTLQWANFKVLMKECMSYYDAESSRGTVGSMIVGDVKQSIYRWRDGDWELLNNISDEFEDGSKTEIRNLDTNFRSEANIINFNNAFFLRLKDICEINKAYDDVKQKVKPGKKPKGEIEFWMLSNVAYKQRHKMICDKVNTLIKSGVKAKDIAILGRNNTILKELSMSFMDFYPEINVVSMESFVMNTSQAVNTIVCALKLLLKPTDKILLATLVKYSAMSENECLEVLNGLDTSSPLLDVVEDIYIKFNVARMTNDSAFVSAFFDYLKDFASTNISTIRNFLKSWDENISQKSIETESVDGVKMMTIHKSKGLEFDNVIIADGAWRTMLSDNKIWVELNEEPFSAVPFTLVTPKKELADTVFKNEYEKEYRQFVVDNMNLLYVAFTRAGKNLYFYGQTSRKDYGNVVANEIPDKYDSQTISGLVEQCLDTMEVDMQDSFSAEQDMEDEKVYHYVRRFGEFAINEGKEAEDSGNVFDMEITPQRISLKLNKPEVTFVQSNRSKEFVGAITDKEELSSTTTGGQVTLVSSNEQTYISTGLLLHGVLSQIDSIDDIDSVLQRYEMEGIIADKSHSSLIKKRIMNNEYAKKWFAPGWTVYNECTILTPEGERRPDRVVTNGEETIVVDFKFGNPKSEHNEQVITYVNLLKSIGLPNVKGYLWYVYNDNVQEVNL